MLALKRPEPRAGVLEIEPYVSGSNATAQGATVFKLSSNETPLGPSPDAVCAYHEAAEHLSPGRWCIGSLLATHKADLSYDPQMFKQTPGCRLLRLWLVVCVRRLGPSRHRARSNPWHATVGPQGN